MIWGEAGLVGLAGTEKVALSRLREVGVWGAQGCLGPLAPAEGPGSRMGEWYVGETHDSVAGGKSVYDGGVNGEVTGSEAFWPCKRFQLLWKKSLI